MKDYNIEEALARKLYHENDDVLSFMIREKSREIRRGIDNFAIDYNDAINMRVDEIAQKSFECIINKKNQIDSVRNSISYTTAYKCSKCGHKKTHVTYVQTRSSDEPMTAFIQCINCKYIFRK